MGLTSAYTIYADGSFAPKTAKHKHTSTTDWELGVLCQKDNSISTQCRSKSNSETRGIGYKTLTEDLINFKDKCSLPFSIDLNMLDDGSGTASTMAAHQACCHKSCRARITKTKIHRAVKRNSGEGSTSSPAVSVRRSGQRHTKHPQKEPIYFFCDLPAKDSSRGCNVCLWHR